MAAGRGGMDLEGVTQEEISKLTKAMKDDKFRSYMDEYCKETSDPKHRKEYLQYLDQLEAKGEMPEGSALLRSQPGCCVKTNILFKSGQTQKCFINIVHTDQLEDLEMDRKDDGSGHGVKLPYSLGPPRPDRDNKDEYCMTADCAVSSRTFFQAMQNPQILKMIIDTATENLGKNFLKGFEEVKKDYKVMQRMQCKGGFPQPMSVRRETLKGGGKNLPQPKKPTSDSVTPSELKQMRSDAMAKKNKEKDEEEEKALAHERKYEESRKKKEAEDQAPRIRIPVHRLVHSGTINLTDHFEAQQQGPTTISTVPKLLKLVVDLPTVKKSSDITMEVTSYNVVIEVPEKYYLDLPLPYEIEEDSGSAKFDKVKQTLSLEMPVVPKAPDPEMTRAARQTQDEGDAAAEHEHDGGLDENKNESDEELPPLEEEPKESEKKAQEEEEKAPPATETPPTPPPKEEPKKRERLEVSGGDALKIATPSEPEQVVECLDEGDDVDLPDFEASEAFAGARPGYVFKLDAKGLGYYRDLRQELPGRRKKKEILLRRKDEDQNGGYPATKQSLVTELSEEDYASFSTPKKNEAAAVKRVLPPALRRYADSVTSLRRRLLPAECQDDYVDIPQDVHMDWHQNRQNVTLFLDVAGNEDVADVQVSLMDRRMTLEFCTRESSASCSSVRWCRRRLRRVLTGPVDPRQWHADLSASSSGGGSSSSTSSRKLSLVLRKADQSSEAWTALFDASASAAFESTPAASSSAKASSGDAKTEAMEAGVAAASSGATSAEATISEEKPVAAETRSRETTKPSEKVEALADVGVMEDSAALDAAVPVVHGHVTTQDGETAAAGPICDPNAAAAASAQQSAAVMGQSVLLRNRFMYQLL